MSKADLPLLIVDIFENQAATYPNKIAIHHGADSITYRALNERANQLARHLIEEGVTRGSMVALCVEQSISRLLFMLAVMKTGAAYVPLDPEYPEARLDFILRDTRAAVLLTTRSLMERFDFFHERLIVPETEKEQRNIRSHGIDNPRLPILESDRIYVIYTSGSTGKPKGVAVQHGAVLNFARHYPLVTGLSERSTVIQLLSYTVSPSVSIRPFPTASPI